MFKTHTVTQRKSVKATVSVPTAGFALIQFVLCLAVLIIVLDFVSKNFVDVQQSYAARQQSILAGRSATAAMNTFLVLLQRANKNEASLRSIDPDPESDGILNSIRIRGDWNPRDGSVDGRYEDLTFSVAGGKLYIKEVGNPDPIEFLDYIDSISFTYFDRFNKQIIDPIMNARTIASVGIAIRAQALRANPTTLTLASPVPLGESTPRSAIF